jgi:ABC-type amino acid transport substrate-binding protein
MMTGADMMRTEQATTQGLLTKHGQIVMALARALLEAAPGDRLLPVQEYADLFQAGAGTVQSALDFLQDVAAARLEARGRLGTYVAEVNYPRLWQISQHRPMIGAMPLPYLRHVEGLATALQAQFADAETSLALRFMRGSTERLQALASGVIDWALVSRFAADTAGAHGFAIDQRVTFGEQSYLEGHVLLLRSHLNPAQLDGVRLGVDFLSADHAYISRAISRGKRVELVNIQYDQALDLLATGAIDAVVWTSLETPAALSDITAIPLRAADDPMLAPLSEAVIVVSQGNKAAANLLRAVLDAPAARSIQRAVIERMRVPSY